MNESGGRVKAVLTFYKATPEQLIVVHDELDIPFGTVRLKVGGGAGGHNGVRSLDSALGTKDYARVRVGIGRPPGRMEPADFVLRDFSAAERKELPLLIERGPTRSSPCCARVDGRAEPVSQQCLSVR